MEWVTIILASLLGAISPAGLIVDGVVADSLRSQVESVEELKVRIDSTPSYQVLQGKVDRVRIASRGVRPIEDLRIDVLELETDPIDIDLQQLQSEGESALLQALRKPLQGAVRVVLTESDIDRALQSPDIKARLEKLINEFVASTGETATPSFRILNADVDFLDNNRVGLALRLQQLPTRRNVSRPAEPSEIKLEVGLNVVAGRSLQLVEPQGTVNGKRLSKRLLRGLAEGLSEELDLRRFEERGITARILQFNIAEEEVNLAAFVKVEPEGR